MAALQSDHYTLYYNWGEPDEPLINGTNVHEIYYYGICMVRPSQTVCSNLAQMLQNSSCALTANSNIGDTICCVSFKIL